MKALNVTDDIMKPAMDRANCTIHAWDSTLPPQNVPEGALCWIARQGELELAITYLNGVFSITGKPVEVDEHLGLSASFGNALRIAFREKLVANVAAATANCWERYKHGHGDTYEIVHPNDKDATVEISFYDGNVRIAGSDKPVTNLAIKNLAKHIREKMKLALGRAAQNRFQEKCDAERKGFEAAFKKSLRDAGVTTTDARHLRLADSGRVNEGGEWYFDVEYKRMDCQLEASFRVTTVEEAITNIKALDAVSFKSDSWGGWKRPHSNL
jgi:hypothetical protein